MKIVILIFTGFFCLVCSNPHRLPSVPLVYESEWAVHLQAGVDPSVLEKEGFEVLGQIGIIEDVYLVRHKETQEHHLRSDAHKLVPSIEVTNTLTTHSKVIQAEQQSLKNKKVLAINDPLFSSQWHLINTGQFGGVGGVDINIQGAWAKGFHGEGVRIAFLDDGYQYTHPDLASGYRPESSYSFITPVGPNPSPYFPDDTHGTMVAGVALSLNNSVCGVGSAYRAEGSGIRLLGLPTTDATDAVAFTYKNQLNHIYSNSWGPVNYGILVDGPGFVARAALSTGVSQGRSGLGSIFIFAAGNGLEDRDDCNYNGYTNALQSIAVAAIGNHGKQTYYSTPGACLLVTAPSSDWDPISAIRTIDLIGAQGNSPTDCSETFTGTSASAPLVSGIVALMLQANPSLTWRDVPVILAKTAVKNDPTDSDWKVNGAGHHVNHKYGFGLVDATAAVNAALNHTNLTPQQVVSTGIIFVNHLIPDFPNPGFTTTFTLNTTIIIEKVFVTVSIDHVTSGDLQIVLTSPSGTVSVLSNPRSYWIVLTYGDPQNYTTQDVANAPYGPQLNATPISGQFMHANPFDACGVIENCADMEGRIAIANGTSPQAAHFQIAGACNFTTITKNLQECGAIAVFIASTDYLNPFSALSLYGSDPTITIPTFGIPYATLSGLVDFENGTLQIFKALINNYVNGWRMSTTRLLDESANGTWKLSVTDKVQTHTGNFILFSADAYGSQSEDPGHVASTSGSEGETTGDNRNDVGVLIGAVVGGIVGLLLVVIVVIFIVFKSYRQTKYLHTCICGEKHGPGGHPSQSHNELQPL